MTNHFDIKTLRRRYLISVPILFALSIPLSFLYQWTQGAAITAVFAPVNESIWEHLKLAFIPLLFWNIASLFMRSYQSMATWLISTVSSLITAMLFIISFYYTYTGAFGIHSMVLDILSLFLALSVAQYTAYRIRLHEPSSMILAALSALTIIGLLILYIRFTYQPPKLPLFQDPLTKEYGIPKQSAATLRIVNLINYS